MAIVGNSGDGKSTLTNALVETDLLPAGEPGEPVSATQKVVKPNVGLPAGEFVMDVLLESQDIHKQRLDRCAALEAHKSKKVVLSDQQEAIIQEIHDRYEDVWQMEGRTKLETLAEKRRRMLSVPPECFTAHLHPDLQKCAEQLFGLHQDFRLYEHTMKPQRWCDSAEEARNFLEKTDSDGGLWPLIHMIDIEANTGLPYSICDCTGTGDVNTARGQTVGNLDFADSAVYLVHPGRGVANADQTLKSLARSGLISSTVVAVRDDWTPSRVLASQSAAPSVEPPPPSSSSAAHADPAAAAEDWAHRCKQKDNIIRGAYTAFTRKLKQRSDANLLLLQVIYVNAPAYHQLLQKDTPPDVEREREREATGIPGLQRAILALTVPAAQQGSKKVLERLETLERLLQMWWANDEGTSSAPLLPEELKDILYQSVRHPLADLRRAHEAPTIETARLPQIVSEWMIRYDDNEVRCGVVQSILALQQGQCTNVEFVELCEDVLATLVPDAAHALQASLHPQPIPRPHPIPTLSLGLTPPPPYP